MIKRIQINDANDVRNARDHMKKIRDGISSGCITVSFDFWVHHRQLRLPQRQQCKPDAVCQRRGY